MKRRVNFINEKGKTYGRWTVLSYAGRIETHSYWICRCDCGVKRKVRAHNLRSGESLSCGCYQVDSLKLPGIEAEINNKINSIVQSARRRKIPYRLANKQAKQLVIANCFYCGIPGLPVNGIDRKNPKLGYSLSNCVSCCGDCNFMKLSMTVQEFISKCKAIAERNK